MRFAAVQYDIAWEEKPANHQIVERMLEDNAPEPGTFVLLPEMGDTGFSFDLSVIVDDATLPWATNLARRFGVWVQAGHAVRDAEDGHGRNCASILAPSGEIVGTYRKVHPFSFSRETDHFTGGDHLLMAVCDEAIVAPMICYDLRFPELWRLGTLAGAQVFTIGANWPSGRQHHFRALAIARAIENQAYVVAVNRTGRDPHLEYAGGSLIVDPAGEVLAEADDRPAVIEADLSIPTLESWRERFPALQDVRRPLLGEIGVVGSKPVAERTHGEIA